MKSFSITLISKHKQITKYVTKTVATNFASCRCRHRQNSHIRWTRSFRRGTTTVLNISKHSLRLHELWRSLRPERTATNYNVHDHLCQES